MQPAFSSCLVFAGTLLQCGWNSRACALPVVWHNTPCGSLFDSEPKSSKSSVCCLFFFFVYISLSSTTDFRKLLLSYYSLFQADSLYHSKCLHIWSWHFSGFFDLPPGGANDLPSCTTLVFIAITSYIQGRKSFVYSFTGFFFLISSLLAGHEGFQSTYQMWFPSLFWIELSLGVSSALLLLLADIFGSTYTLEKCIHHTMAVKTDHFYGWFVISLARADCKPHSESQGPTKCLGSTSLVSLQPELVTAPNYRQAKRERKPCPSHPVQTWNNKDGWGFCPNCTYIQTHI